jgi:Ca-activated chloride channel family protein
MASGWAKSPTGNLQERSHTLRTRIRASGVFLTTIFALTAALPGHAQSTGEVHVLPRMPIPSASTPAALRANVDMVLVNVTVLDRSGHSVGGLEPANFTLHDDKQTQTIKYLSNVDEPVSLVVILDGSASMATRMDEERKAVSEIISSSNPQDAIALIAVSDVPQFVIRFDDPIDKVPSALAGVQPAGQTALWDAMYLGLKELKNSPYSRKAMIVISDGGDNHSRYSESELRSLLKEADVEVYAIGLFNRYATRREEKVGPLQLEEVTGLTGGRVLAVQNATELYRAVAEVSREIRNQYILGYYPTNRARDGNWRKLRVELASPVSREKLRLHVRQGYYGPAN